MKIKSLLIFVFTLMSLTAFAQSGGIKGKVVSREGRVAVDGVKVSVTPGEMTATTDGRGGFVIENVEPGEYTLQFEAPEFEPLTLVVRVDKMVRDINTVILVPEVLSTVMDDSIFAEFDTESGNDAQYYGNVFKRNYMIQREGQFKGYPLRTYVGNNFQGGYSDHFPVYIYIGK